MKIIQMLLTRRVNCQTAANYVLRSFLGRIYRRRAVVGRCCKPFTYYICSRESDVCQGSIQFSHNFSSMAGTILVQARDIGKLHEELEAAINEHRLNDAWDLHEQHMLVDGFARNSIINLLIARLAESSEFHWLEKAYGLVEKVIQEQKESILSKECLMYLAIGLAKCGQPTHACNLLRKLIEMEHFPPVAVWSAIIAYMSENSSGAYLAAELVLEIGYLFQDGRIDPRKKCNKPLISMKPNTTSFNIALVGCLLFGTTRKAEQLLDMMPQITIKKDATSLIIMAHVYERNGRREELKKLRRHFEEVHNMNEVQFRQFYNCLLSCHLKFRDLDSASSMILEMLHKAKKAQNSLGLANLKFETDRKGTLPPCHDSSVEDLDNAKSDEQEDNSLVKGYLSYDDFIRDKKFSGLELEAKRLLEASVTKLQGQIELIMTDKGILKPTDKAYVKLVKAFLEASKTKDLVEFLIEAEKEDSPVSADSSILFYAIDSCISLGWLDRAHDLLDEMRLAGIRASSSLYTSLLKAYLKENKMGEASSLARDARRAGIQLDAGSYEALIESRVLEKDTVRAIDLFREMKEAKISPRGHQEFNELVQNSKEGKEAGLISKLLEEIQEQQKPNAEVHDWNNVIHFFCKKQLMQDAEKALKKMISLGHSPNAQTFHSMVTGYAAIGGKYIEVTELWGEMKSLSYHNGMKFDQELLDAVLYTLVRGGFFIRANEVVDMMEKGNMFIDKYKYRALFLKYHRTLYRGKMPKFQTENQLKRREAAQAFKKWVGL
ncbi:pentatricopeptide repeat-containing protein At1g03100, mitochondrial [Andrographis paniculata]|uniref:pentatricopeptide repeat-containing protein At1g03100, mitochondrial n=1 Tax=Andrographis paniculata TaxID=175694 RepID=UPI0021E70901|nr:pentatricopeptide repeat-containing protein At1g03100, mitochondrial [Andrographis paniculata]